MSLQYRYDHRPVKRRWRIIGILTGVLLFLGAAGGLLLWDLRRNQDQPASTSPRTVQQVVDQGAQHLTIDEPYFRFELPADWKEVRRQNTPTERSITWQATRKGQDNRLLTIYIDALPLNKPLNRLVPVMAQGNVLIVGEVSDNCATFTQGGTLNVSEARKLAPAPAKYKKIDFICNLPNVVENEVGTGAPEGINTVTIKGPTQGAHKYFFLFTDRNNQPNYSIFTDALKSFKAK